MAANDGQRRKDVDGGVGWGVAQVVGGGPDAGATAVFFEGNDTGGQTTATKEKLARGD